MIVGSACAHLSIPSHIDILSTSIHTFSLGEIEINIGGDLGGEDICILQSVITNDHLVELLLYLYHAKHAGAKHITVLMPFFTYGRLDGVDGELYHIADMLIGAGVHKVLTIDIHSNAFYGAFSRVKAMSMSPAELFSAELESDNIIVSPDAGSTHRAAAIASCLGAKHISMNKIRTENSVKTSINIEDKHVVCGEKCVIVDDIIDTGATILQACIELEKCRVKEIAVAATHIPKLKPVLKKLSNKNIKRLITTNTIQHTKPDSEYGISYKILNIEPIIAQS